MIDLSDPYQRIFWSADVDDESTLISWIDQMPQLWGIKIDRAFVDENEWGIFPLLHERGICVFADAKLYEIPTKLEKLARIHCRKAAPWMLNTIAGTMSNGNYYNLNPAIKGGLDGLKRFANVCHDYGVRPCAVTVLTTVEEEVALNQYNGRSAREQVLYYVEELQKAGITDVVCAPTEAEAIRKVSLFDDMVLHTPGVRMPWSPPDDQARTLTVSEAIQAGSATLVIGRPITNGPGTPTENLDAIAAEVQAVLN